MSAAPPVEVTTTPGPPTQLADVGSVVPDSPISAPSLTSQDVSAPPVISTLTESPIELHHLEPASVAVDSSVLTLPEPEPDAYQPNPATHAIQNSGCFVQPTRLLTKISDAQKASRELNRKIQQEHHSLLITEFDALLDRHSQEQAELAKQHNVTPEYLEKLKGTSVHYKAKREVNLENAKIHKKSVEMNADRDTGNRYRMKDIRQMVKDDPAYQNLSRTEEDKLKGELIASREEKKLGARPTNRSAAQDYRRQLESLNDQITSLSERTGSAAVCFFTRTSLEDTYEPNWICSANAANFAEDVLKRNMWDVARLFEQWACTSAKVKKPDSLGSIREQCSKLINGGLKTASKLGTAAMNYSNYDTQVIQRLGVKLVGWTYHEVVSPYEIHTIDDLRTLHNALVCGACFWLRLSKRELAAHKTDIEQREAAGETVTKKRKERSDKGVPKGPRKKTSRQEADSDKEEGDIGEGVSEAGPSKKRKVGMPKKGKAAKKRSKAASQAKSQLPPSNEFIDDTDLEEYE